MADGNSGVAGFIDGKTPETVESLSVESSPEELTVTERQLLLKNRGWAFNLPPTSVTIPILERLKTWDDWWNSLLGMTEMAYVDGILLGKDTLPVPGEKEQTDLSMRGQFGGKQLTSTSLGPFGPQ